MPLLAETSIAVGLRPDQLEVLGSRAELLRLAAGETILSRDDTGFPLMVLLEGEAEVKGLFGQEVSVLPKGSLIGEIAFLDHGARTAHVVAKTAVAIAIFSEDLIAWLNLEHPDVTAQILFNLSRVLCEKLRWAQRLIDAAEAVDVHGIEGHR